MDFKKLAQLDVKDLKNIDYQALLAQFKKRPDMMAAGIMVAATLAFCVVFYSAKRQDFISQRHELAALQAKETAHADLQTSQQALKMLKAVFPEPVAESGLIEIITEAASRYEVTIDSFSPASVRDHATHAMVTLSLNSTAPTYGHIWKFIHSLESENKSLKIDSCSLRMLAPPRQRSDDPQAEQPGAGPMEALLTLTMVNFKNE